MNGIVVYMDVSGKAEGGEAVGLVWVVVDEGSWKSCLSLVLTDFLFQSSSATSITCWLF